MWYARSGLLARFVLPLLHNLYAEHKVLWISTLLLALVDACFSAFLVLAQQDELRSILWIYRFANLGCSIFGDFGIRIFGCRIAKDLELRIVSIVRNNAPGRFRRFETNLFYCIPAGCIIVVHKFIPNTLDNTPAMFTLVNNAIKSNYRHFNHLFTLWNNNNRGNVVDKFIVVTS